MQILHLNRIALVVGEVAPVLLEERQQAKDQVRVFQTTELLRLIIHALRLMFQIALWPLV